MKQLGDIAATEARLTTPLDEVYGGTGTASYTTGDLLYASSSTALSKLATGASGTVLAGGSTPSWTASPSFTGATLSGMTLGSVLFAGTGGVVSQDNSHFFWDDTNNQLQLTSGGTNDVPLLISGVAFQQGDLTRWRTSAGTVVAGVSPSGSTSWGTTTYYTGDITDSANARVQISGSGDFIVMRSSGALNWASTGITSPDTGLARSAAGVLKVTNGSSGTGSLLVPTVIGGTSTTADLTLQTTSGVGATGADMHFLVGNNGATEAMTILNSGNVGILNATPGVPLDVTGTARATTVTGTTSVQLGGTASTDVRLDEDSAGVLGVRLGDDSGYAPVVLSQAKFGGTTSSFSMIEGDGVFGTGWLYARLADDSGYASFVSDQLLTTGLVTVGTSAIWGATLLRIRGDNTGMELNKDYLIGWSSTAAYDGSRDLAIGRNAAGVLEINNGTPGTYRDLQLRTLTGVSATLTSTAAGTKPLVLVGFNGQTADMQQWQYHNGTVFGRVSADGTSVSFSNFYATNGDATNPSNNKLLISSNDAGGSIVKFIDTTGKVMWTDGAGTNDLHLARGAAAVLNVMDGTTGRGQIDTNLKTTASITASTTQTQGQGALTSDINEVSTCANANDTVTLPTASAGRTCIVINNGAQTLKIFPASGDNLGAGVDTATTLASGSNVFYVTYDATNWETV